jgi:cis-L-3-hydroxyproline dehydratase
LTECEQLAASLNGRARHSGTCVIVTAGHDTIRQAVANGTLARLHQSGVQVLPDLCWCSISEPLFPPATRTVMTNSGKYAHYGPGLSGRAVRFGGLEDCVQAALTGRAPLGVPQWLRL